MGIQRSSILYQFEINTFSKIKMLVVSGDSLDLFQGQLKHAINQQYANLIADISTTLSGILQSTIVGAEKLENIVIVEIDRFRDEGIRNYKSLDLSKTEFKNESNSGSSPFEPPHTNVKNGNTIRSGHNERASLEEIGQDLSSLCMYGNNNANPNQLYEISLSRSSKNKIENVEPYTNTLNNKMYFENMKVEGENTSMVDYDKYSSVNDKIRECTECNYTTKYPSDLKRHTVNVHQKLRNYECQYCEKSFGRKDNLTNHVKS